MDSVLSSSRQRLLLKANHFLAESQLSLGVEGLLAGLFEEDNDSVETCAEPLVAI